MKILTIAFFIFSLTAGYAQQTISSLDLASPAFTPEERARLITADGLYFVKTTFAQDTLSGSFYRGSGGIRGSTEVGERYTFYIGPTTVSWDTYFNRIGLGDYATKYKKVARQRNIHYNLGLGGLLIGVSVGTFGFTDLWLGSDGDYILGSRNAALWSGILGATAAVASIVVMYTSPSFPPGPSDEYLITISNEENRKILR